MKKLLKCILIVTLILGGLLLYVGEEDRGEEHHHLHGHVHIVSALDEGAQVTVNCPSCGAARNCTVIDPVEDPSCTASGRAYVQCSVCNEMFEATIPALGHNYQISPADTSTPATCTSAGSRMMACIRCGDSYTETIPALGHNYTKKVTKKVTCEEDGTEIYTCSRCNNTYSKTIPALGHDIEYTETKPTCTEKGHREGICKNCGEKTEEVIPALGHDFGEMTVIKEATCSEDGVKEAVCEACGEVTHELIPRIGHDFPEEWTIEKEAGLFSKGLKSKTCEHCKEVIEEEIPQKVTPPMMMAGAGVLAAAGAGLYFFLKKPKGIVKESVAEEAAEEAFKPEFETKTVVTDTEDEDLLKLLKDQVYLEVTGVAKEELEASIEESEPHLLISDPKTKEELDDLLQKKKEVFPETPLGLVLPKQLIHEEKTRLESLKEEGEITGYVLSGAHYTVLTKLVLPILKPEISSDETLDNIGMISDALGIPLVSTLINAYVSGRDIKATVEESEKIGVSESATIIGDIASILGLDAVAGAAGLVGDIDSIKASFDKEAGAYEKKEGAAAVKDAVEVIGDLIDR